MASKKIVLYQPQQVDESFGPPSSKDMLPLEMLTIAAFPLQDGYEVVIVDGSLYSREEAHRRLLEACEGALLYATTGILGYMVKSTGGRRRRSRQGASYPDLPAFIGGWFASVRPDLQLETGLYDAVVLEPGRAHVPRPGGGRGDGRRPGPIARGRPRSRAPGGTSEVVKTERRSHRRLGQGPQHALAHPRHRALPRAPGAGRESARDVLRMPTPPSRSGNRASRTSGSRTTRQLRLPRAVHVLLLARS